MSNQETYIITKPDEWSEDQWFEIIDAVEETVVSVASSWEQDA
jgi:hypothetical protein